MQNHETKKDRKLWDVMQRKRDREKSSKGTISSCSNRRMLRAEHVCDALARFICLTSANMCGNACPLNANTCWKKLQGKKEMTLDGEGKRQNKRKKPRLKKERTRERRGKEKNINFLKRTRENINRKKKWNIKTRERTQYTKNWIELEDLYILLDSYMFQILFLDFNVWMYE